MRGLAAQQCTVIDDVGTERSEKMVGAVTGIETRTGAKEEAAV